MFEGLDAINWAEIEHIHGSAASVPQELRRLAHDSDALLALFAYGQESGDIHDSTSYIVPFVIDLLAEDGVPNKHLIIDELSGVCWGFPADYRNIRVARNGLKVHDAFISKLPVLRELARSGDEKIRVGVIDILSRFKEFAAELMPEFMNLFETEPPESVQVALITALSELISADFSLMHELMSWCNQVVENQERPMPVRVEAAFAILELATKWKWTKLEAEMSLAAVDVLATMLNESNFDDTATLFPEYEKAAAALAKLNLDLGIAVLQSGYLKAQSTHFLVREALDQVFYRINRDKAWMYYDGSFPMRQHSFWYDVKEVGMSIRRDYIPNHTLSAQFGNSPQRRLLTAIVDTDHFWEIPTNLFSFFYGLPDNREELRALLAKS